MQKTPLCCALAATLSALPVATYAYEAGDWVVRAGATHVAPNDDSGKVFTDFGALGKTGLEVSVEDDTQLGLNLVYFVRPHWAVELLAATPFNHDVNLEKDTAPLLGNGALGDVKHLPPTLSALYYFNDSSARFQPYVGVGINYTTFFEEEFDASRKAQGFSDLELEDSWGLAAQVGFDYQLNERWSVNGSVRYLDIDTTAEFKLGGEASKVDVDIDPFVSSLMLGYRF
ncbi:OmpW family protein [Motiliproteus sp. SC1-56]|uniref:OmpW/AlkL family protein n=1 Tax=Motiliproteus sp. SC1-56 TaxID=2799565 RepID=UPI001A8D1C11|nr:OmpW family outer membrane protein [Motiliproteus sp. SC1-56]